MTQEEQSVWKANESHVIKPVRFLHGTDLVKVGSRNVLSLIEMVGQGIKSNHSRRQMISGDIGYDLSHIL